MNTLHNLKFVISNFWWTKCYLLPPSKISNDCASASEHSVHWGINPRPPSKISPLLSFEFPPPPQTCKLSKSSFFRKFPGIYWFFVTPLPPFPHPPYNLDFSVNPKNIKFFISFTPTYLLKVSKFLVKISQFEFFVVIEQSILVYKLFCR